MAQPGVYAKIDADYAIIGKHLVDPSPTEKKDRIALLLTGDGAKKIYDAMPGPAKRSPCEDGQKLKSSGALDCSKTGNDYACSVSILLKSGASTSAFVC